MLNARGTLVLGVIVALLPVAANAQEITVTLLGTGTPVPAMNRAGEQDLLPPTRKHYAGPVEVGEDLMVIEVGEKIAIRRPVRPSP